MIGVAFQNQQESQNIGYVIPVPTIHHFLEDSKPDRPNECAGFCSLGVFWQVSQTSPDSWPDPSPGSSPDSA